MPGDAEGNGHERAPHARAHPAGGPRVLGLEDAAQRHRDGGLHRARAPSRGRGGPARAARPARALGARLLRRPGGARLPGAPGRRLLQHPRDRALPRQAQALLRRRHPRDGQPPPLPLLGRPHRGPAHRAAAERGQDRRPPLLRGPLRRSGPAARVPRGDDRAQPRGEPRDRRAVPVGRPRHLRRRRHRPGRPGGADRPGQPAPHRRRASTCRRWARSSRTTSRRNGLAGRLRVPRRQLLHRPPAAGGRHHDGPHPPRLGPRPEADAHRARPTTPCPRAAR